MRDIWALLSDTFRDWYEDRAQRLGAALAYSPIAVDAARKLADTAAFHHALLSLTLSGLVP